MKKIFQLLLLIFAISNANSQSRTVVSGKILNIPEVKKASLAWYKNFISFELKQANEFVLGVKDQISNLYLEPGDSIYVTLDYNQFDETIKFSGKGEANNNFLAQHYLKFENDDSGQSAQQRLKEMDAKTYFNYSDSLFKEELKYLDQWKNKLSKDFYEIYKSGKSYEIASQKLNYWQSHQYLSGIKKITFDCNEAEYAFLKEMKTQNDLLINNPKYCSFLGSYLNYKYELWKCKSTTKDQNNLEQNYYFAKELFNGKSRNYLLACSVHNMLNYGNFKTAEILFEDYKKVSDDKDVVAMLAAEFEKASELAPGKTAPNFTLKNLEGKDVSLSDFKGKVVYLDFWASWCGPCRAEIPSAAKMEEDLKDKEVVFLKVSIDENEQSWRKIIEEKQLGGVHLIANGFGDPVPKSYQVEGIPKYVLIDKDGNLIDSNAPRPSSEKEIVDKILAALPK